MSDLQDLHPSVWVAQTARLYGRICIGEGSSVWDYAVMRAECEEIRIGRMTNVQDLAVIHVEWGRPTRIGDFCSIAHRAVVHACSIGDDCLVGVGAVIMDQAVIGAGSLVGAGAVVPEGREYPPGSVLAGVPARVVRERDCARPNRMNAWLYHRNAQAYRSGEHRAWDGPEFEAWRAAKQAEVDADRDR